MSYNKGQSQFSRRGNLWAMIRQLIESQSGLNPSAQGGGAGAQVIKATWDFAVDGGAIATLNLVSSPTIPTGMIIFGGLIDGITLPVGPGASIAWGFGSGAQAASLKAATAIATYTAGSVLAILPVWTAASAVKVAADTKITATVSGAVITAGKIAIQLYGHMNGE